MSALNYVACLPLLPGLVLGPRHGCALDGVSYCVTSCSPSLGQALRDRGIFARGTVRIRLWVFSGEKVTYWRCHCLAACVGHDRVFILGVSASYIPGGLQAPAPKSLSASLRKQCLRIKCLKFVADNYKPQNLETYSGRNNFSFCSQPTNESVIAFSWLEGGPLLATTPLMDFHGMRQELGLKDSTKAFSDDLLNFWP